jgi:gliding motility-associated lipoprotein GldD
MSRTLWLVAGICLGLSCTEYTPKPRGYFRIEPPLPVYRCFSPDSLPFSFHVSAQARVELPPSGSSAGWLTLSYPALHAAVYCSYLPVDSSTLEEAFRESGALISLQTRNAQSLRLRSYENPQEGVYAMLYESEDSPASPVQFTLTDSARRFFRGTLLCDRPSEADSLAPVVRYLRADVVELIQSFSWKK